MYVDDVRYNVRIDHKTRLKKKNQKKKNRYDDGTARSQIAMVACNVLKQRNKKNRILLYS